jgi:hypothetical protein
LERLYFFFNYMIKEASYSEKMVPVYQNSLGEKREDFNITKAAFKLSERTKMGRHIVLFESERETVMGDILWCLNPRGRQ